MSQENDGRRGEGDRGSTRRPDRHPRDFVPDGRSVDGARVPDAAAGTRDYVDEPGDGARAKRAARRGPQPRWVSVDELVAKGQTVVDKVRPIVSRAVRRLRARLERT